MSFRLPSIGQVSAHWSTVLTLCVGLGKGLQTFGEGDYSNGLSLVILAILSCVVPAITRRLPPP